MAQLPAPQHFWDLSTSAALEISKLKKKGSDYSKEAAAQYIWGPIIRVYFPENAATPLGNRYVVNEQAYRGLPVNDLHTERPDIVVIRMVNVRQLPTGELDSDDRDIAWVECKAPKYTQPHSWNRVMGEIVDRLHVAHPSRMVFFILATGMQWMPFVWDPSGQHNPAGGPLHILKGDGSTWAVDSRVYMIDPARLPNQRHISTAPNGQRQVNTSRARHVNFWDMNATTGNRVFQADLDHLEDFFNVVQGATYVGFNPSEF